MSFRVYGFRVYWAKLCVSAFRFLEVSGFWAFLGAGVTDHHWVAVKIMVPFLGTLNNRCRAGCRTQKGTLILRTTPLNPQLAQPPEAPDQDQAP